MQAFAATEETMVSDPPEASARLARERQFEALLQANGPALRRLAGSYSRSPSDREDLLQDIAIALWQALPRFRGEASERTFLFRIAHNRCIAQIAKRRSALPLDDESVAEPADPQANVESRVGEEQEGQRLMQALRLLPVIYREVIVLTLEDLDYREIAQVLGISASNVGVRLNRARAMLREHLGERA